MKRDIIFTWERYEELDNELNLLIDQQKQLNKQIKELKIRKGTVLDLHIKVLKGEKI